MVAPVPNVLGRKQCASKNQILHVEKVSGPVTTVPTQAQEQKHAIGRAANGNQGKQKWPQTYTPH
jgi:hypothetical protein